MSAVKVIQNSVHCILSAVYVADVQTPDARDEASLC
jgi:hypothetical protein